MKIYAELLKTFIVLQNKAKAEPTYKVSASREGYSRDPTGDVSKRIRQPIVITENTLYDMCTSAEWHVVGRIIRDLKECNALWHLPQEDKDRSGTLRRALKGLIQKEILLDTGSTGFYLVNPLYIRRGDLLTVVATMIKELEGATRITLDHYKNLKPVRKMEFDQIALMNSPHV